MRILALVTLLAFAVVAEEPSKAERAARAAVKKNPKDVAAWLSLADEILKRGEPHDAWAVLEDEAMPAVPGNLELTQKLGDAFLAVAAKQAAAQGDGTEIRNFCMDAERMYDEVLKAQPKNAAALFGKAQANYQLSDVAERLAATKKALADCLAADPKFAAAHALQADMLYAAARSVRDRASRLAKYAAAEDKYKTATDLDKGTALWFVRLGHSRIAQGKSAEAKAAYLDAIKHHPDDATAILSGLRHLAGRDWKKMIEPLKEAGAIAPKSFNVWYYLGYAYYVDGRNVDAVEAYKKALAIKPGQTEALFYVGQILEKQNKGAEALDYYRRVLKANPAHEGAAGRFYAMAIARAGDIAVAEEYFEELLKLAGSAKYKQMGFYLNDYALLLRNWAERVGGAAGNNPSPAARKRIKRSGEVYEMAAAILPDEAQVQSDTGLLFQFYPCNRDPAKAKRYFTRSLDISDYVYRDAFDGLTKICIFTHDWELLADYAEGVIGAIERGKHAIAPVGASVPKVRKQDTPGLKVRAQRALQMARAKLGKDG